MDEIKPTACIEYQQCLTVELLSKKVGSDHQVMECFIGHIMKFGCWLLKGVQVRIGCGEKWRKDLTNKIKWEGLNWILGDKLMSSFLVWEF